ncbi:MAG TPA: hypothetical protein ENF27_00290 [Chloroflexi bacterium]|nr:MAG: hypothetical protein DRI65_04700 [Chloroflexota bacterium]HDN04360.1 hypothetical protein [Chloroflexota bacterium]
MKTQSGSLASPKLIPYVRNANDPDHNIQIIGSGSIGGKAQGLVFLQDLLSSSDLIQKYPQTKVIVPDMVVIGTEVFDSFLEKNNLVRFTDSDHTDDQIAHAFQQADLPFFVLGDLRSLVEEIQNPIAVRSSSLLEDATYEPFAGIYSTKMIPNEQFDPDFRFRKLSEAIKFVYASTFFKAAKSYRNATGHDHREEKMALIIQRVHGARHHVRFYPDLSGVARSYNFYPVGKAKPEDGVVSLALGLGKTIVDGGRSWTYSPAHPRIAPPYGSINELLKNSQREFWAVNMGAPLIYDPIRETEYLIKGDLPTAEKDGTLKELCSTYDSQGDRLQIGMGNPGPRVLNFAPLLQLKRIPLNKLIQELIRICEEQLENPVEIEFAMTFSPPSLGLLQVRSMVVSSDEVEVSEQDLGDPNALAASEKALGNGLVENIKDIVYVIPENFELEKTREMAEELDQINGELVRKGSPYLLIIFGRLGSSDPWLGIPVNWGQISGSRVIIETYQEGLSADMSQGSHFFHNLTSLGVSYISLPRAGKYQLDWSWLSEQKEIQKTKYLRHIELKSPLGIKIDGKAGRAIILKSRGKNG